MNETVAAVLAAVVLTALFTTGFTTWWARQGPPPAPPPPPRLELDVLEERLAALTTALESRLSAIERKPAFDPSPIVGRLAAIEGGLADLKKRPSGSAGPVDLGPVLAALEALRSADDPGKTPRRTRKARTKE